MDMDHRAYVLLFIQKPVKRIFLAGRWPAPMISIHVHHSKVLTLERAKAGAASADIDASLMPET